MNDENAPIIVTNILDAPFGGLNLRDAIALSEEREGADTIVFQLSGSVPTVTVSFDDFTITDDLTLELNGITLVRNTSGDIVDDRFFAVNDGGSLTLNGGTLSGGDSDFGGAIFVGDATLTVNGTTFINNTAEIFGGAIRAVNADVTVNGGSFEANTANSGGAIYTSQTNLTIDATFFDANLADDRGGAVSFNSQSAEEALEVTNSSFLANMGDSAGAIFINHENALETGHNIIENSTFAQNVATNFGGAIYTDYGELTIIGSTISENQASNGGGVASFGDSLTAFHIGSSIIAGNTGTTSGSDIDTVATSPFDTSFISLGQNLIGDGTLPASAGGPFVNGENGDLVGTAATPLDAGLNDLTTTDTGVFYTLASDSPALDVIAAATNISTQITDQRGDDFVRVADAFLDIGAIENQDPNPSFDQAPNTVSIAEGDDAVALINGTDLADDLFGRELTYVFVDGDNDNALFEIRDLPAAAPTDVLLAFIGESDFEDPTDGDRNNSYLIQVSVRDSGGNESEVHDLNVSVTDVNEPIILSGLTDTVTATQGQTAVIDLSDLMIANPEGDDVVIDLRIGPDNGTIRALESDDVAVTDSGSGVVLTGTITDIAAYLDDGDNVFFTASDSTATSDIIGLSTNENESLLITNVVEVDINPATGAITINGGTSGFVTGGASADTIITGDDETFVFAGSGDDVVAIVGDNSGASGDGGNDIIGALNGDHFIEGGAGADILVGGIGVDDIDGGSGNDVIKGDVSTFLGEGDIISGGTGDDLIEGGLGADIFIFSTNDGNDTIGTIDINFANPGASTVIGADFDSGIDVIELDGDFGYSDANVAFANVSDVNGTAVFADQGTTITFEGLTTSDLSADDFILA